MIDDVIVIIVCIDEVDANSRNCFSIVQPHDNSMEFTQIDTRSLVYSVTLRLCLLLLLFVNRPVVAVVVVVAVVFCDDNNCLSVCLSGVE